MSVRLSRDVVKKVLSYFDDRWKYPSQVYYDCDAGELRRLFPSYQDFLAVVEELADAGLLERGCDDWTRFAFR
ncbi:MAG: hypothetical protein ACXQT6_05040, partial [Candidatus Methanospirareceae archaeon]